MSRTWNGSDLCISLGGRLITDISRTTSCGLVTPSRTCLVSNLHAAQSCLSAEVTTTGSWTTPPLTVPIGSGTWPKLVSVYSSLIRLTSTARMDDEPMSSPIGVTLAIGFDLLHADFARAVEIQKTARRRHNNVHSVLEGFNLRFWTNPAVERHVPQVGVFA